MFGVEITDSAYVVCSMRIMARMGTEVLDRMGDGRRLRALPALGRRAARARPAGRRRGRATTRSTSPTSPRSATIWSYGSGYGGNALLGKKCYSLRIASAMARDEGWLAEHMLILKLTSPEQQVHYVAAAFPSACGKTNLAMLEPDHRGLEGRDARRRHRLDALRRGRPALRAQPGVRPVRRRARHRLGHQPQRDAHHRQGQLAVHQRRAHRRRRHLVGGHDRRAAGAPHRLEGPRLDARQSDEPQLAPELAGSARRSRSARSSRRSTTTRAACRSRRSSSAAAARRRSRWSPRPATGCTASSWAPRCRPRRPPPRPAQVGVVRRDPMAMLPFIGYNAGDYFGHWIDDRQGGRRRRSCRRSSTSTGSAATTDGGFLWPGFGENGRVLKWVIERIEGRAAAVETPIGLVPDGRLARRRPGWT